MDKPLQSNTLSCCIRAPHGSCRISPCLPVRSRRGTISLVVITLVIASALVAYAVLDSSLQSFRMAQRNDVRAEMTAVAESELDWLFFNAKMAVMSGTPPESVGSSSYVSNKADAAIMPSTTRSVYLDVHRATGWRVQRSVRHLQQNEGIDASGGGSRRALLDFIEAKIILLPPETGPFSGLAPIRIGRNLVASQSTIFQYGVFFDGDLELNPGENYTINGDIYTSGNAFIAPLAGKSLTINEKAKLRLTSGKMLNGSSNSTVAGTVTYNPAAPALATGVTLGNPLFALTGTAAPSKVIDKGTVDPSDDETVTQLERLTEEENLLGGLDALATAKARPDLFGPAGKGNANDFPPDEWSEADKLTAINNVKRSLIVPPPANSTNEEYPNNPSSDDPAISVQRAYNRAGLIVDVSSSGNVTITQRSSTGTLTDVTSAYTTAVTVTRAGNTTVTKPGLASSSPTSVYDAREGRNIKVTDLDIEYLRAKVASVSPNFNGLIYVNLKNSTSGAPAAVRIVNGETVPTGSGGTGLSIATNGGLYVKGSFNTGAIGTDSNGQPKYPTSMLMADAITVLSYAWNDASATAAVLTGRIAGVDDPKTIDDLSTIVVENEETEIKVNAGLITGNSISNGSTSSGGAQNLVRYLENWTGKNVSMMGSLGRVFTSTQFSRPFIGTAGVYRAPLRTVTYDPNLAKQPPAGSPILTGFSRGDVFRF